MKPVRIAVALAASVPAVACAVLAGAWPEHADLFAFLSFGAAVVGLVGYLFSLGFERLVAVRYLRRSRTPMAARLGLPVSLGLLALGLVLFFTQHGGSRGLETLGVLMTFVGGLFAALFFLLALFSIYTAVSML